MKCDEIQENFAEYFDKKLEKKKYAVMREHFANCPHCVAEYEKFKTLFSEIEKFPKLIPDNSLELNFNKMLNKFNAESIPCKESIYDNILKSIQKIIHAKIALPAPIAIGIFVIFLTVIFIQSISWEKNSENLNNTVQSEGNKIQISIDPSKEPTMIYPAIEIFDN